MRSLLAAAILVLPLSLFSQQTPAPAPTQTPAPAEQSTAPAVEQPKAPAPTKEVGPDDPVITLTGTCPQATDAAKTSTSECKTVVTRAEFERIKNALAPEAPESARRQIAETYAQALVVNNEGIKEGVQNDPSAEEVFKFAKMRAMGQLLARHVQQNAQKVSDDEVKKYFENHRHDFDEAVLTRIIIPKKAGTKKVPVTPAMEKAYAERLRKRFLAGEKAPALQKEAFTRAAVKAPAPETNVGAVRREALPPTQVQIFDLKPGEVSQVIAEPNAAFIYKVEAETTPELDPTITAEIRKIIAGERLQNEAKRIGESSKPTLNPDYFGEEKAPQQGAVPGVTVPPQQEQPPTK